jgi:hypothetical protein
VISAWARRPAGRAYQWAAATMAVATALTLTGCVGVPQAVSSDGSSTAIAKPPVPGHGVETLPAPLPQPTDDVPSQDAALALASEAVTAFARPEVSPDQWWAELSPLLSPAALVAYSGTDPVEVPAREVIGPARTGVSPSAFLSTVFVPTDAGEYAVLMVREGSGAPWLVERITRVPADATQATASGTEEPGP